MYGHSMGTLQVMVNQDGGSYFGEFGIAGSQGNAWKTIALGLPVLLNQKVRMNIHVYSSIQCLF